jgi:pimeloyl-ACP methyl ester carboxylesterase
MVSLEWSGLRHRARFAWLLALGLGAWQAEAAEVAGPRKAGDVRVESGIATTDAGEAIPYELGTLFVPENRTVPGSRLIGVGFARIRAAQPTGAPPIFILTGGPGSSVLDTLTSSDAASLRLLGIWAQYRTAGDVVVVDQRGFSTRGDVLRFTPSAEPLDKPYSRALGAEHLVKQAHAAVAAHPDKDLSGYTIVQCAEDVNDLRQALGYRQVTLYGASFGSQWGFAVMRLHPDTVKRAVLTDVEPLNSGYDMPSHVYSALQRIAWDADRDAGLAPYLPRGGVMAALRAVRERFAKGPIKVTVKEEKGGRAQTVVLGLEDFQGALLRSATSWPAFILSLYHRRHDDWAREVIEGRRNPRPQPLIGPLIDTSLGVTAEREHLLRTDAATDLLGTGGFNSYLASAAAWPTPDLGDAFRLPVPNPTPVLFLHGDWDTSTPIENLVDLLPYFPNSHTIRVHRGTHGDRKPLRAQHPQVWAQLIEFFKSGSTDGVPVDVTLSVPEFQRPPFPPPAGPVL